MSTTPHRATPLPDAEYLDSPTLAERHARGHARRAEVSFEELAAWDPAPTREDPVRILQRQAVTRTPELVPIRYGRMLVSPFAFFRGGAAIMAADLSTTPVAGLRAQLCGDAHLLNFGIFDTPERSLSFGLNDSDETLPGPVEWDLKRLTVSIEIAGRDMGFSPAQRAHAVQATARLSRGDARVRPDAQPRRLVRAHARRGTAEPPLHTRRQGQRQGGWKASREGAAPRPPARSTATSRSPTANRTSSRTRQSSSRPRSCWWASSVSATSR